MSVILLYRGTCLNVSYEVAAKRFVQFWTISPSTIDDFKTEMLVYTALYKEYKPSQSLWLQHNFTLNLDPITFQWIETYVNIPCQGYGNEKLAFVVSKDVLVHMDTMDVFEETNSILKHQTKHFTTEEAARKWLEDGEQLKEITSTPKISFDGVDEEGNIVMKLSAESNFTEVLKAFKSLKKNTNTLELKNKIRLKITDIVYIRAEGHYVEIFCENELKPIIERISLTQLLQLLPINNFVRTHRSYIVNVLKIRSVTTDALQLHTGEWIKLSRTYKEALKDKLLQ